MNEVTWSTITSWCTLHCTYWCLVHAAQTRLGARCTNTPWCTLNQHWTWQLSLSATYIRSTSASLVRVIFERTLWNTSTFCVRSCTSASNKIHRQKFNKWMIHVENLASPTLIFFLIFLKRVINKSHNNTEKMSIYRNWKSKKCACCCYLIMMISSLSINKIELLSYIYNWQNRTEFANWTKFAIIQLSLNKIWN